MQRMSRVLRTFPSLAGKSVHDVFSAAQSVWSLNFNGKAATNQLDFHEAKTQAMPVFHILDFEGNVVAPEAEAQSAKNTVDGSYRPDDVIPRETAVKALEVMLSQRELDKIALEAQRQGRLSFHMTCFNEEAASVGTAAGLQPQDEMFMQYREAGAIRYRGLTISEIMASGMGNEEAEMKGRQMPMHLGKKSLNVQMISSPLCTQVPQAAGTGYALRCENEALAKEAAGSNPSFDIRTSDKARICVCFVAEGAASEGDFHAGMNFAAVSGAHTLVVVRNNGYAISTVTNRQYVGDGIAARGVAYGIPTVRVDGMDAVAMYHAVRKARELILTTNRPVLLEAISYRLGDHSTSDDSTAYRTPDEIKEFTALCPIDRFERFCVKKGWWTPEQSTEVRNDAKKTVLQELRRHEKVPLWPVSTMHDDVFEQMTPSLKKEHEELVNHFERHKDVYTSMGLR